MDADDHPENSQSRKSNALPKDGNGSQSSFSHLPPPPTPREFILSVASKIASQPLQNYGSNVWGVLTAISDNARKRQQGMNILLTEDEHLLGRVVADSRYQIESNSISANHCRIYRKRISTKDACCPSVFLKDTSTNGTYLNWERLKKNSQEAKICHGDIISLAAAPQHEVAFAFVYREVVAFTSSSDGGPAKRKAENVVSENKRLRGLGIGAPDGPISLDDFRSLQRSNKELRRQLEDQVLTIDALHKENRASKEHHELEVKKVRESVSKLYDDEIAKYQQSTDRDQRELGEAARLASEQKHSIEDLQERLSATAQSCKEANEVINSQKASLSKLKGQIDEERDQRREEREKAAADLKAAVQKAHAEAQDEVKRLSDAASMREREQQEVINKLQESEKERCLLVETLRSKLEETRQKLVTSDNKVRQLESQLGEQQLSCANERKKVEELEGGVKELQKELESVKGAREEAWAKVSSLELEINAAIRDLDFERRRLKGARERIMLRETQLRAFYSTTEEISALFAKQQEQLKAMQRTLEDEENYENTSFDFDLNVSLEAANGILLGERVQENYCNKSAKTSSAMSAQRFDPIQAETSTEEASTEKNDGNIRSQDCENTQEVEFTSADAGVKGGFGSDIDGVGTAPVLEGDAVGTERVLETESPGVDGERNTDSNKGIALAGETMCLDDEGRAGETNEQGKMIHQEACCHSQTNQICDAVDVDAREDTEAGGTVRTADLLASEVAGSWACSTAPSVHGENESPRSRGNEEEGGRALQDSNSPVAGSQSAPSTAAATRRNFEHQALSEMIQIVAPESKHFFGSREDGCERGGEESASSSDTENCTDNDDDAINNNEKEAKEGRVSDSETQGVDLVDPELDDPMDQDDEATQEDSLG
ncbi:kinesin-like protein KIF15 isoform X2 [Momordica charantia]|uniref:Kinesin-like protein KIF15 isoform X2 n=1 Tax=Momordica charantia TaxID=3673 RepID=A0A6J1D1B6_MOMCH|nr:kinesin-like protein KIF15 isoform X2 [Momordica charantia]